MFGPLGTSLRQLLLPAHCAACGSPAPADARLLLCEACAKALAGHIAAPYCPRCGRHVGPHTADETGCMFCRLYPIRHEATVRLSAYEGPMKALVLRCKYQRRMEIASLLGRLLAERLALASWADAVDLVVPVPLHWTRRLKRGFNQAEIMARTVAGAGRKRFAARVLRRVRATPPQSRLESARRPGNVRGAFRLGFVPPSLKGRHVLLVDDVMTSGSTVSECARMLKRAGVAAVYVAVVATADYDEPGPW